MTAVVRALLVALLALAGALLPAPTSLAADAAPGAAPAVARAADPSSGTIVGTVTGPDAQPVRGIAVIAYTVDPTSQYRRSGVSDDTGHYEIANLAPGTYKVEFRDFEKQVLAGEFWNDTLTWETATEVPVAGGQVVALGPTSLAVPVEISQPGPTQPGAGTGSAVITVSERPVITGRAHVGRTLRVRPGTWSPSTVELSYRWFARGVAIKGARTAKLRVTPALRGKRIQVQVTASRPGSLPVMAASRQTPRVAPHR